MNTTLTVTDPLAEREVSIVITLAAGKQSRDERPALVSIGLAGQMPIIKSGVFGATMELIEEAWTAFGVQVQLAEQTAAAIVTDVEEIVAETPVLSGSTSLSETEAAVAGEDVADLPSHCSTAKPSTPKPTASNLSLF